MRTKGALTVKILWRKVLIYALFVKRLLRGNVLTVEKWWRYLGSTVLIVKEV